MYTRNCALNKKSASRSTQWGTLGAALVLATASSTVSAQAPLPRIEGDILIMPVVQVIDTPFRIDWKIITGENSIELLLHDYEVLGSADTRGAPSFWDGVLNLPRLEADGLSYWGEFYVVSEQPVKFGLANAGFNDPGDSGLQGKWRVTDEIDAEACGEGSDIVIYELSVQHQGQDLKVISSVGEFDLALNGNSLQWSGSYAEDGGTTTTTIDATVAETFDELSGSSEWTWSNGSFSCSGTSTFSAVLLHN